jgi:hypothetical protein
MMNSNDADDAHFAADNNSNETKQHHDPEVAREHARIL